MTTIVWHNRRSKTRAQGWHSLALADVLDSKWRGGQVLLCIIQRSKEWVACHGHVFLALNCALCEVLKHRVDSRLQINSVFKDDLPLFLLWIFQSLPRPVQLHRLSIFIDVESVWTAAIHWKISYRHNIAQSLRTLWRALLFFDQYEVRIGRNPILLYGLPDALLLNDHLSIAHPHLRVKARLCLGRSKTSSERLRHRIVRIESSCRSGWVSARVNQTLGRLCEDMERGLVVDVILKLAEFMDLTMFYSTILCVDRVMHRFVPGTRICDGRWLYLWCLFAYE